MNSHRPTLLISNVLPARPGDEAYNNICMRLWDRLLEAALPNWNVIREYAQEDGAEGAALRAQHADAIIIMGGEDVHPSLYGATQGYEAEGRHWYRADRGQIALVDYAVRTGTPLLGICRGMQIINGRKPVLKATETHDRAYRERDQHLQWRQAALGFNGYGGATKNDGEGEYERVHMDNDSLYKGYARSTGAHAGRTPGQAHKTPGVKPPEHMRKPGTDSGELFAVWEGRKRSLPPDWEKSSLRATLEATSAPPLRRPHSNRQHKKGGETTRPPPTGKAGTHRYAPQTHPTPSSRGLGERLRGFRTPKRTRPRKRVRSAYSESYGNGERHV